MRNYGIDQLILATHNPKKLREFQNVFSPLVSTLFSARELGLPEPEENGKTFAENAIIKARAAAETKNMIALGDDSGLCVDALGGLPGIYTARWHGGQGDQVMIKKIRDKLGANVSSSAHFVCALALAWPDGRVAVVEEKMSGVLVDAPEQLQRKGFVLGFVPEAVPQISGDIMEGTSAPGSHRSKALNRIVQNFFTPAL